MANSKSKIPAGPAALTNEWLSDALGAGVCGFTVEALGEGAGLIGLVCSVALQYEQGESGPARVIAKFPSPIPENRAVGESHLMYLREVRFYQELADEVSARTPACYYAELDDESSDFVLLLEDLSAARPGDQTQGCDATEAETAIGQMAALHATWWGRTDDPELDWIPLQASPNQREVISQGFEAGWPRFMSAFGDLLPAGMADRFERVGDAVGDLQQHICREPLAVIHGDFRLDNMFFGSSADQPQICLFDWQTICKSSGTQDLAYFLTQSLRTPDRRSHEHRLVRRYWDELKEKGVAGYPFERCWDDYRSSALYCFAFAVVIAGSLDLTNPRGSARAGNGPTPGFGSF